MNKNYGLSSDSSPTFLILDIGHGCCLSIRKFLLTEVAGEQKKN